MAHPEAIGQELGATIQEVGVTAGPAQYKPRCRCNLYGR